MLSRFFKRIKINEDNFAIFNSLLMDVIYCNKKEMEAIKNQKENEFSKLELKKLYESGIFVKNASVDDEVESALQQNVVNNTKDFVSLMYIIPTSQCNLKCRYCFIGEICNETGGKMSDEVLYSALNEFNKHLKEKNIEQGQIIFYGGEPLMGMDIIQKTVDYIKKNDINILLSMVSNATLIDEKIAKFLSNNDISIGISIDGPKVINDKNRIFKSDETLSVYNSVLNKINILKNYDVNFGLSITLTQEILDNQKNFLQWLKDLEVKNICFNLLHFTTKTESWKEYYNNATKFLFLVKKELPYINEDRLNRKYSVYYKRNFKWSDCAAVGANQICVAPDGNVTICHGYWNNKRHSCGKIFDGIKKIINTAEYKLWNNNLTINKNKCLKCPAISICGGGCAMQSETLFGNMTNVDKAFCIHTKKVLNKLIKNDFKNIAKI